MYYYTGCIRRELKQILPYTGGLSGIIDAAVGQRDYESCENWSLESSDLSC